MLMINPASSNQDLYIEEMDLTIRSGEVVEIPDAYCIPRVGIAGAKLPPIMKDLCPQLQVYRPAPEDPKPVQVAKPKAATPKARVIKRGGPELPPAVAALVASGEADDPRDED